MPAASALRRNHWLQARMTYTMALIGAAYVLFITLLAVSGVGPVAGAITVGVVVVAHYLSCDRLALAALRARPIDPAADAMLHATVERLCALAEVPMVGLARIPSQMPNACTIGRSPANLTVCVTAGLLSTLEPPELEAVLAHELAHVASRDAVVMTLASPFASLAALMIRAGRRLGTRWTRPDADESPWFVVVLLAGLVYAVSYAVFQVLSRYRELGADAGAALITGRPQDLAGALARIAASQTELTGADRSGLCGELAAFYVIAPDLMTSTATVFATHPSLAERLTRLHDRAPGAVVA